jgi:hypothetical protein
MLMPRAAACPAMRERTGAVSGAGATDADDARDSGGGRAAPEAVTGVGGGAEGTRCWGMR